MLFSIVKKLILILILCSGRCALAQDHPGLQQKEGGDPCWDITDPEALEACWIDASAGSSGGGAAKTCSTSSACPALNEKGKAVSNCWYQKDFKTGYKCILFCKYVDGIVWGSDGGTNCS